MVDKNKIAGFGVATIPVQSNVDQTATYRTLGWDIKTHLSFISMYPKRLGSQEPVELSTSSISPVVKTV